MQLLAVCGGKPGDAVHEGGPVGEAGERVPACGLQLATHPDAVSQDRQGERHGGRDDEYAAADVGRR